MGLLLFAAGVLRLGFVADFFGKPVLLGYINGVALIVIASQLGKLFGITVDVDEFFPIEQGGWSEPRRRERADRAPERGASLSRSPSALSSSGAAVARRPRWPSRSRPRWISRRATSR